MGDQEQTVRFIGQVKQAIIADAQLGVVPWTITTFSRLHDYVDANMYLERAGQVYDPEDPASTAEINLIEDAVSAWLALGRLAELQPVRVTWLVTERYQLEQTAGQWREQIGGIPDTEPITAADIPIDYLTEIEDTAMYAGTKDRVIDDVERAGRRER